MIYQVLFYQKLLKIFVSSNFLEIRLPGYVNQLLKHELSSPIYQKLLEIFVSSDFLEIRLTRQCKSVADT